MCEYDRLCDTPGERAVVKSPLRPVTGLPWCSLKYEEVHLKTYANGLEARSGSGQRFRFYNESRPHQALGYKTPAAVWAAEQSPVDLPLRLDDAGASPTTPQSQQQQNVIFI
jgi:putative transposase